jgi:hypothetical protein
MRFVVVIDGTHESPQEVRCGSVMPGCLSRVRNRAAMRSRCSGVSGGKESTTVLTCSVSTASVRSGVAGLVLLGGSLRGLRAGFLGEGGSDSVCGSVALMFDVVVAGRVCSALFGFLVMLCCCEWCGLRRVVLSSGTARAVGLSNVSRRR